MIKACIFDLDGTIINTLAALRYCVSESLAQMDLPPVTEEEIKTYISNGRRALLKRALAKYGQDTDENIAQLMGIYDEVFREGCDRDLTPYEGMPGMLWQLKGRGYKLGCLTNKNHAGAQRCISKVYGTNLFDSVVGSRPGYELKPDTGTLKSMMEELGAAPEEVMYFGDSWVDMKTGTDAGCVTTGVLWGYRVREELAQYDPAFIISSPDEIPGIIRKADEAAEARTRSKTAGSAEADDHRYEYVIDGNQINTVADFYRVFAEAMTEDLDFEPGHTLDAFADLLRGGFGKHGVGEKISIIWNGFTESRVGLGDAYLLRVLEIMLDKNGDWDVLLKIGPDD